MSSIADEFICFDNKITTLIQGYSNNSLTKLAILFTNLGSGYIEFLVFLIVGSYLLFRLKHIWDTFILTSCLLGTWLLNIGMKMVFQRQRPTIEHLIQVGGYSFPSGHAMVSTAFYGFIGYLLWLNLRNLVKFSWVIPILTLILILCIGVSRVYLGVHFPSDVLAGFAVGAIWLIACIYALNGIRYFKSKKQI